MKRQSSVIVRSRRGGRGARRHDMMVMKIEGDTEMTKPYYMEGEINGQRLKTKIDSGSSPVTIFALDENKTKNEEKRAGNPRSSPC